MLKHMSGSRQGAYIGVAHYRSVSDLPIVWGFVPCSWSLTKMSDLMWWMLCIHFAVSVMPVFNSAGR